jgi:hypothetical protein
LIYVAAVLATVCFGITLRLLGAITVAADVMATSRQAAACMRDPALGDDEKEKLLQTASISLLRNFLGIVARGAAAVAAAVIAVLALQAGGLVDAAAVASFLATWQGILLSCVAMAAAFLVAR